ncbi:MAG: hypothetical protein HKM06_08365 [Spirochaetales bacterium]|nr:hypothetical protein [Spirochaetales bacterium]
MAQSTGFTTLVQGQFINRSAEDCGKFPGAVSVLLLILSSLMMAFPFMYSRYTESVNNGQAQHYRGLGSAWLALAGEGGNFKIENGAFVPDPRAPKLLKIAGWTVFLGEAPSKEEASPFLAFVKDRVLIHSGDYGVNGPLSVLNGINGPALEKLEQNFDGFTAFVKGSLFSLSTAEVPGAFVQIIGLMFLQNFIFVLILGMFLAMSGLRIAYQTPGSRRAVGYWASLKTVAALTVGPSLVAALVGGFFPTWGIAIVMMVYSLLLGVRVILVYMGRFKNKKKVLRA